ncbi:MAG: hypothetical protein CVU11_14870 [Bacteroidetes bacterium HGW-Bacteroidetes-6]|jgi:hypothetical protein|nr:MAG: hypothetical protein CVU11_14870 [Bacteroidetes bacterium HGW-Bacteroidetes-6]
MRCFKITILGLTWLLPGGRTFFDRFKLKSDMFICLWVGFNDFNLVFAQGVAYKTIIDFKKLKILL